MASDTKRSQFRGVAVGEQMGGTKGGGVYRHYVQPPASDRSILSALGAVETAVLGERGGYLVPVLHRYETHSHGRGGTGGRPLVTSRAIGYFGRMTLGPYTRS